MLFPSLRGVKVSTLMNKLCICIFSGLVWALSAGSAFGRVDICNEIPGHIDNIAKFTDWLRSDFKYRMEYPDEHQTPVETLRARSGDCEDFAALVLYFMDNVEKLPADIIIVKFRDLHNAHALCVWKNTKGHYCFTSNSRLFVTKKSDITDLVEFFYPDWEKIYFADKNFKRTSVIKRQKM